MILNHDPMQTSISEIAWSAGILPPEWQVHVTPLVIYPVGPVTPARVAVLPPQRRYLLKLAVTMYGTRFYIEREIPLPILRRAPNDAVGFRYELREFLRRLAEDFTHRLNDAPEQFFSADAANGDDGGLDRVPGDSDGD